jgi:hypothetical protein
VDFSERIASLRVNYGAMLKPQIVAIVARQLEKFGAVNLADVTARAASIRS